MSEGRALVRFHDWRTARDHKAATRHFWRCRCIGLVAVPVSIGLATLVLAVEQVMLLHPAAYGVDIGVARIVGGQLVRPAQQIERPA